MVTEPGRRCEGVAHGPSRLARWQAATAATARVFDGLPRMRLSSYVALIITMVKCDQVAPVGSRSFVVSTGCGYPGENLGDEICGAGRSILFVNKVAIEETHPRKFRGTSGRELHATQKSSRLAEPSPGRIARQCALNPRGESSGSDPVGFILARFPSVGGSDGGRHPGDSLRGGFAPSHGRDISYPVTRGFPRR